MDVGIGCGTTIYFLSLLHSILDYHYAYLDLYLNAYFADIVHIQIKNLITSETYDIVHI